MFGTLPLLALIFLTLSNHSLPAKDLLLRESILKGFLLWGSIIVAIMEILSIFHGLTFQWVLVCWLIVLFVCTAIIYWHKKNLSFPWHIIIELSLTEKIFAFVVVIFVSWLALLAFFSPPNTIDAMAYHMSRVVHWVQNQTVAYYPTRILRQLYYPPGAEYLVFQFQLLSKGDQWANGVQWLSMIGSLVAVSLVARELGAGRWGQLLSVIVAATIPMGILQATSTQTDYVAALWLCLFIYFFLRWRKSYSLPPVGSSAALRQTGYQICNSISTVREGGASHLLWMSLALGLSILTKGTGIVYAIPFLIWIMIIIIRRLSLKSLSMLAIFIMVVGGINSGTVYRTAQLGHGNLLMPASGKTFSMYTGIDSLTNEHFGWHELADNAWHNARLEFSNPQSKFEDNAQSPLQVVLLVVAIILMLILPSARNEEILLFLMGLMGMLIAFNLLLKWQIWGLRFHLSFFVMASPLIGAVFEKVPWRAVIVLIMAVLLAYAIPYVFSNQMKSYVTLNNIMHQKDRREEYFGAPLLAQYKGLREGLDKIQCRQLGLLTNEFVQEYPLWTVFNPSQDSAMRIEHVLVNGVASPLAPLVYPLGDFEPCALITVSYHLPNPALRLGQDTYLKIFTNGTGGNETNILVKVR